MAQTKFTDTLVRVTATFDESGHTRPEKLELNGRALSVVSIGRQWQTEQGRHILVETGDGARLELLLDRQQLLWRIKRIWPVELAA